MARSSRDAEDDAFEELVDEASVARAAALYRERLKWDDELFEREWARHGPQPPPGKPVPVRTPPTSLDNPHGHKRYLTAEEMAAEQRVRRKGKRWNPLKGGRY